MSGVSDPSTRTRPIELSGVVNPVDIGVVDGNPVRLGCDASDEGVVGVGAIEVSAPERGIAAAVVHVRPIDGKRRFVGDVYEGVVDGPTGRRCAANAGSSVRVDSTESMRTQKMVACPAPDMTNTIDGASATPDVVRTHRFRIGVLLLRWLKLQPLA